MFKIKRRIKASEVFRLCQFPFFGKIKFKSSVATTFMSRAM